MKGIKKFFVFVALCLLALAVLVNGLEAKDVNVNLIKRLGIGYVYSVAWSPDGKLLAAGTSTGVYFLNPQTLEVIKYLKGHRDYVLSVSFSPNGSLIVSGSRDRTIKLWRVKDGKCIATLEGHQSYVNSVSFSPSGSLIASGGGYDDKTIKLWRVKDSQLKRLQIATTPD